MLKYDPPKITLVYHFEAREAEKYFHEVEVERKLLETLSDEDLASHLYVTEAYYFNPKQIKRQQVLRLVRKLKEGMLQKQQERRKNFF
jgi:non-homologous end joining protein Ku